MRANSNFSPEDIIAKNKKENYQKLTKEEESLIFQYSSKKERDFDMKNFCDATNQPYSSQESIFFYADDFSTLEDTLTKLLKEYRITQKYE